MTVLYTILSLVFLLAVFFFLFPIAIVVGDSMLPSLKDGDVCITRRILLPRKYKYEKGNIYVYRPPDNEPTFVVKRLMLISGYYLFFEGDNARVSHDSRDYGFVESKSVIAELVYATKINVRKAKELP